MKAIIKVAMISMFAISTVSYAGSTKKKECTCCSQKTCTKECKDACGQACCAKTTATAKH